MFLGLAPPFIQFFQAFEQSLAVGHRWPDERALQDSLRRGVFLCRVLEEPELVTPPDVAPRVVRKALNQSREHRLGLGSLAQSPQRFAFRPAKEGYTMDRARGAIRALMARATTEARVRRNGTEQTVPAEEVRVGEVVLVRPGEKIPVDG